MRAKGRGIVIQGSAFIQSVINENNEKPEN